MNRIDDIFDANVFDQNRIGTTWQWFQQNAQQPEPPRSPPKRRRLSISEIDRAVPGLLPPFSSSIDTLPE